MVHAPVWPLSHILPLWNRRKTVDTSLIKRKMYLASWYNGVWASEDTYQDTQQ